ncbi:MAG TPA: AmmeMemoRadiSam system protein B [Rhodocyclaceae bacterium]|nr:AmmeMemoRadiSam system protein B [Rhodocyclaceae bacterium]
MNTALKIRPAAVAGMFYPDSPSELADDVGALIRAAAPAQSGPAPKALIVPHAGYVYSGPVAASAYAALAAARHTIRRVVLLGPAHRVALSGLALPLAGAFATPLGTVSLDVALAQTLLDLPQVTQSDAPHALEHSLEVQLPFLQSALDDFSLLPLAVGDATMQEVAEVLDRVWGGPETLIVVSSDLSHYHAYAEAQRLDRNTAEQILALSPLSDFDRACGAIPVNGLISCAKRRGLVPRLLDLRNSGDTAGDKSRVVGYGAFAFGAASGDE